MAIYSLYKKTHNITGLKYLGSTSKADPIAYTGSGIHWLRHIKKHGYDVTTEILGQFTDKNELKEAGIKLSAEWNIVESKEWANLRPEGGEGWTGPRPRHTEATKKKMRKPKPLTINYQGCQKGKFVSAETREKLRQAALRQQASYRLRIVVL